MFIKLDSYFSIIAQFSWVFIPHMSTTWTIQTHEHTTPVASVVLSSTLPSFAYPRVASLHPSSLTRAGHFAYRSCLLSFCCCCCCYCQYHGRHWSMCAYKGSVVRIIPMHRRGKTYTRFSIGFTWSTLFWALIVPVLFVYLFLYVLSMLAVTTHHLD